MIDNFGTWDFATSPVLAVLELMLVYLFYSRLTKAWLPEWEMLLLAVTAMVVRVPVKMGLDFWGVHIWEISDILIFFILCFAIGWKFFSIKPGKSAVYSGVLTILRLTVAVVASEVDSLRLWRAKEYVTQMEPAIACLLFEISVLVLANVVAGEKERPTLPAPLCLVPVAALAGLLWLAYRQAYGIRTYSEYVMVAVGSVALCVASVVAVLVYQLGWERKRIVLVQRQKEEQLQMEQSYYEILERQNQQLRSYAHDAKNHLEAIRNLNQDPKVEQYIAQMEQQLQAYTRRCHSGNRALDVMVDKYVTACELKNIAFTYDVQLCNLEGVEDFDLVAILGNLLDNALTAAQDAQEKWVELATALRNGYQVVVVENSCDRPPIVGEEGLRSTKAGGENHGFGLKSVAKALKKYEGDFQWDYDQEKRRFTMTVMIGQRVSVRESRRMAQDAKC